MIYEKEVMNAIYFEIDFPCQEYRTFNLTISHNLYIHIVYNLISRFIKAIRFKVKKTSLTRFFISSSKHFHYNYNNALIFLDGKHSMD